MPKKTARGSEAFLTPQKVHSAWRNFWLPAGVIIGMAFLVYAPSITNGFMWDDDVMLTNNQLVKSHDGLRRIWCSTELSDYFPLTSTSFWIEWRLWGMNPVGYNVTNILLHALSGVLLWRIFRRLKIPGAWLAALLFTIHPVCVASVDWIAERKNTLSLLFYGWAFLMYLGFEQSSQRRTYWAAVVLFLLALLSKTSVVVLPLVLLLCAWWQRGKITKLDVLRSIPFFVLSLILGLVTVWFQLHEVLAGEAQETDTFLTRILGGGWGIWFYLSKILLPLKLSFIYPQWDIDPAKWRFYIPGILWLLMLVTCWRFRKTWGRPLLFGLGYFTIALLPVLGFFDMDFLLFTQVADHLQYIAIPGIIALAVGTCAWCCCKYSLSSAHRRFSAIAAVLFLSVLTWRQTRIYDSEEMLWRDTVKKNPTAWIAYHNLADTLIEMRRFEEAAAYYEKALALKPDYAKTHNNLGNALNLLGRIDEAIDEFLDAIQNKPEMAEAHNNLAVQYFARREYQKALEEFRKAAQLKPDYASAYFGAGNCQLKLGELDQALDFYFSGLRYNPNSASAHYIVGIILKAQGEKTAAIRHFRHALRVDPQHNDARQELILLSEEDELRQQQGG